MVSVSVQRDRVAQPHAMATGAGCTRHLRALGLVTLVMADRDGLLRLLALDRLAAEHGAHERTLHPIRMGCNEWTFLLGVSRGSAFAVRFTLAFGCAFAVFVIAGH